MSTLSPNTVLAIKNFSKNTPQKPSTGFYIHRRNPTNAHPRIIKDIYESGYESDCDSSSDSDCEKNYRKHYDPDYENNSREAKLRTQLRRYYIALYRNSVRDDCDSDLEFCSKPPLRPIRIKRCCKGGWMERDEFGLLFHVCGPKVDPEEFYCEGYIESDCDDSVSERGVDGDDSKSEYSVYSDDSYFEKPQSEHYSDYEDEQGNPTSLYEIHEKMRIKAQTQKTDTVIREEMDRAISKAEHIVKEYQEIRGRYHTAKETLLRFKLVVKALYEAAIFYNKNIHPLETKEDCKKEVYLNIYYEILDKMEKEYLAQHSEYSKTLANISVNPRWEWKELCEDSFWNIFYMSRI